MRTAADAAIRPRHGAGPARSDPRNHGMPAPPSAAPVASVRRAKRFPPSPAFYRTRFVDVWFHEISLTAIRACTWPGRYRVIKTGARPPCDQAAAPRFSGVRAFQSFYVRRSAGRFQRDEAGSGFRRRWLPPGIATPRSVATLVCPLAAVGCPTRWSVCLRPAVSARPRILTSLLTVPATVAAWLIAVPIGASAPGPRKMDRPAAPPHDHPADRARMPLALVFLLVAVRTGLFPDRGCGPRRSSIGRIHATRPGVHRSRRPP